MGKVVKKIGKTVKKVTGIAKDASGVINAIGNIAGANKQSKAIKSAADTEAQASRYALDLQERMFNQQNALQRQLYDEQVARQEPSRLSGLQSQNRLNELMGLGANTGSDLYGKYARDFSMKDFTEDPGFEFAKNQREQALKRLQASSGGLFSGSALKAAARFGQDIGNQYYNEAFNRYQTNRANQLQPLQSMMGAGQTSVNALGNTSQAYGSAAGTAAQNYATGGGGIATTSGANQADLRLARGNVSAGQYGNYGNLLGAIGGLYK